MAAPNSKRGLVNAANRESYRQQWHAYNLQSRFFDEAPTPTDFSKLPRLKRPRTSACKYGGSQSRGRHGASASSSSSSHVNDNVTSDSCVVTRTTNHGGGSVESCEYSHGEVEVFEGLDIYRQLLLETSSISPCDEHFTKFLLNGFNAENHSIESSRYVMVTRRAMCFSGTWKWAFYCSCDPARSQVLQSASEYVQQSSLDLPGCLHVDCLTSVLVRFDENLGITPQHQSQDHNYAHASGLEKDVELPPNIADVWPVSGNPHAAVIVEDQSFAVIDIVGSALRCLACRRVDCRHINKITGIFEQTTDLPVFLTEMSANLKLATPIRKAEMGSVASWKPIPFKLESIQLQEVIAKPITKRVCIVNSFLQLIPSPDGMCDRCHSSWSDAVYLKGEYSVFTLQSIHQASVFFRKCNNVKCESELQYDGLTDCLFNMTTYLIDHCVLRQYMYQFLYGRSPIFAFYSVWVQMQNDAGNLSFSTKLHYNKFAWAWYGFLHLLDINYQDQFICKEATCGTRPDKSLFLADSKTRKLLKKFCKSSTSNPFSPDDFLMLTDGCKEHQNNLVPLLTEVGTSGYASAPPAAYKPLLQALSATTPVCGLIHPEADLLELLEKMAQGFSPRKDLNAMALLADKCPILSDLIASEVIVSEVLFPILCEMLRLTVAPFEHSPSSESSAVQAEVNTDIQQSSADFDGMRFWPHFPQQRSRPTYAMDGVKSTRTNCRKESKTYGRMTPGIFAAFCPHGICYGFELMNQFESPNVPFTLFFTRFATPPKIIVYDNACHLHTYCLNREPDMFKDTKFLIDRLHWPNHTACSIGYKLDGYARYKAINSQVAEQMNSSLQRIKVQLSYMGQENFLWHCRFFLWGKNVKKQDAS